MRSGRRVMKQKRLLQSSTLGLLSMHSGINIEGSTKKIMSSFNGQMAHHETMNHLMDDTANEAHPLTIAVSQASNDVMHRHQAMKDDDADLFR